MVSQKEYRRPAVPSGQLQLRSCAGAPGKRDDDAGAEYVEMVATQWRCATLTAEWKMSANRQIDPVVRIAVSLHVVTLVVKIARKHSNGDSGTPRHATKRSTDRGHDAPTASG